jgi:hypothetical protein
MRLRSLAPLLTAVAPLIVGDQVEVLEDDPIGVLLGSLTLKEPGALDAWESNPVRWPCRHG